MKRNSNRTSKIDYTLIRRRQIVDFLDEIKHTPELTPYEMDQKMAELFSMGVDVPSILLDLLRRCDDEMVEIIAYALEDLDDPGIIEPVIDILIDPDIREHVKLRLLSTLANYGVDTSDPEFTEIFEEAFDDIEGVMERSVEEMLTAMQHNDEAVTFMLEHYQQFPLQAKMELVKQFGEKRDGRAVQLLKVLALLNEPHVSESAITYLGKIKSPLALSALEDIAPEMQDVALRKMAEKSAQRLRLMEIETPVITEPFEGEIHKVVLSFFDGTGSRILWFTRYADTDKTNLESINLMLRTGAGVVDCYGSKSIPLADFDVMVAELKDEVGGGEVSYEYGLILLKDALWQNQENGQPVPPTFFLWKLFFRNADVSTKAYIPSWTEIALDLDTLESDVDMLDASYDLHELDEFMNWFEQSDQTYDYYEQLEMLIDRYNGQRLEREIDRLFKRYANEVFEPQRDFIRRNLEYAADCLFRQPDKAIEAQVALAAALHLEKQSVASLDEHPFILRMMEESLERIAQHDF